MLKAAPRTAGTVHGARPSGTNTEKEHLSAGVAIVWGSSMDVTRVPEDWYAGKLAGEVGKSRVIAVILRCRKISILLIELYLYSGEGLGQVNLDLIQAVVGMVRCSGLPAIICGDFQTLGWSFRKCCVL